MRVRALTKILPPYRIGFYNELARPCDLRVVLDSRSAPDLQWKTDTASGNFRCTVSRNTAQSRALSGRERGVLEQLAPKSFATNRIRMDLSVGESRDRCACASS